MPSAQDDRTYYQRRIARCDELATQATCPSARLAHQELARLYREKLDELGLAQAPYMETDLHHGLLVTGIASARGDA